MEDLISIIIPIYKVEQYLDKCIKSIVEQTYQNLEIILVDDGSPDNCPKMCEEWKKQDKRIKVIHKLNGGLSSARNAGLDICKGKYLIFIDSDDYIDCKMVEKLYNNIINNKADMSICNFYTVKNNKVSAREYQKKEFCIYGEEKYKYLFNEYGLITVPAWNKIYKKELFNNIRYAIGKVNEDEFIICELIEKCKKISYICEPLYYYVQRPGSIMNNFNIKRFDCIEALEKRIEFFERKNNLQAIELTKQKIFYRLSELLAMASFQKLNSENKNYIKEQLKKLKVFARELKKDGNLDFKQKVKVSLAITCPRLLFVLINFKNIITME